MNNSELKVKNLLLDAFADELGRMPELSHQDCLILRNDLITLRDCDIKNYLPQVLIDLLGTHTNNYRSSENVEAIISLLNPIKSEEITPRHPEMEEIGIDYEFLAKRKIKLYTLFSTKQAQAIAAWIELAVQWEDLFFSREQVKVALDFWTRRSQSLSQ